MPYAKGDRVKHPGKPDWGLGRVLENSNSTTVRIFFVGVGEKQLSLAHVIPEVVTGTEAKHPVLDNLLFAQSGIKHTHVNLLQAIEKFLKLFPQGFHGDKYLGEERNYKVAAHDLALEKLGRNTFDSLLSSQDYDEICKRALKLSAATNLMFPNEKMALKDGLDSEVNKRLFAESLHKLLFGKDAPESRFKTFSSMLLEINAAKWTTATYYPYLFFPDQHIFLKPTVTREAASMFGFDINYRPQLNWLTYKCVLVLAEYLRDELAELKPRDMIDVQSFMWCIASDE